MKINASTIVMLSLGAVALDVIPLAFLMARGAPDYTILWLLPVILFPLFAVAIVKRQSESGESNAHDLLAGACKRLGLSFFALGTFALVIISLTMFAQTIGKRIVEVHVDKLLLLLAGLSIPFVLGYLANRAKLLSAISLIGIVVAGLLFFDTTRILFSEHPPFPGYHFAQVILALCLGASGFDCLAKKTSMGRLQREGRSWQETPKPPAPNPLMTVFKFECPHCGQRIAAHPDEAGSAGVCQTCSNTFTVPAPSA
ncbi:MAG: hypothetical protein ABIP20_02625 [Chthoniobacteraceae bacterium]